MPKAFGMVKALGCSCIYMCQDQKMRCRVVLVWWEGCRRVASDGACDRLQCSGTRRSRCRRRVPWPPQKLETMQVTAGGLRHERWVGQSTESTGGCVSMQQMLQSLV